MEQHLNRLCFTSRVATEQELRKQIALERATFKLLEMSNFRVSFSYVHDIVVGQKSLEIWLLVRPRSEYREEDLPE